MDQRMDMIQRMRNQEATSHYRLHQALRGTSYDSGIGYGDIRGYRDTRTGYGKEYYNEESIGSNVSSLKIRILLAIFLGIFAFSLHNTDRAAIVTEVVKHISENKTIEEAADQVEAFAVQIKKNLNASD